MQVTFTGATGLIGSRMVATLSARGDALTVLTRDPQRARARLEQTTRPPDTRSIGATRSAGARSDATTRGSLQVVQWDPLREQAPADALANRDAIIHLAGENIAQRWTASAKRAIYDSRVTGTKQLIRSLAALAPSERPQMLLSGSAIGYYGSHKDEPIDEEAPPGSGFLAQTCSAWEDEASAAESLGVRVVKLRTGVVLDPHGGALGKLLTPFRLGLGGPVASGRQFISWIHPDDLVGIALATLDQDQWQGPVNATAPQPQRNRDFSRALARTLHRPALLPIPAIGLHLLYGEMAETVTTGARVLPARALVLGYQFSYPQLDGALRALLC